MVNRSKYIQKNNQLFTLTITLRSTDVDEYIYIIMPEFENT
jgi:hypothetical protein